MYNVTFSILNKYLFKFNFNGKNMFLINDLTVVIVTYKTNDQILDKCIQSIIGKAKILIVENSDDKDFKSKYEKKYNNLDVVLSGSNLGYGAGNNKGISLVKTRYALISNPDVIYENDFFINLKIYIENNTDFNIIGPMYRSKEYASHGHFDDLNKDKLQTENVKDKSLVNTHWIVGCTMFIDLEKFESRKLFDENFFLFFEEFDLCRRTLNKGGKIFASKNLYVKHLGHKGSLAADPKYEKETAFLRSWHWMWSSFYYYEKNFSYFYAIKCMYGKFFRSLIKMIYYRIFYNSIKFKMYHGRVSGIWNRLIGRKSWYRLKID